MTVVTTVSARSAPLLFRCRARMAMTKSPSTRAPLPSTASTRSPSPSKARPRSKPSARTTSCRAATWVEPHSWLMLSPSGAVCSSTTSAPDSARARGAARYMAPLAQSTAMRRPERSVGMRADDVGDVVLDGPFDDVGAPHLVAAQRDQVVAADVGLDLGLFVVGELDAEVAEDLDAVVGERVVRRRHHHAGIGCVLDDERRQTRGGDDAGDLDRAASARDAGHQGRFEHGAGDAGVAADEKPGAGTAVAGQHVRPRRGRPAARARE